MPFLIISMLIAIAAAIFAIQNADIVTVNIFTSQYQSSLALVLMITFILGILMDILVLTPRMIKNKVALSQREKRIRELEKTWLNKTTKSLYYLLKRGNRKKPAVLMMPGRLPKTDFLK